MASYSYDLTTAVGQARFHAADTDVSGHDVSAVFSDEELQYCLNLHAGDPIGAAAMALEMVATDKARLAIVSARGSGNTDASGLAAAYAERARTLRTLAMVPPAVAPPEAVFTPDINAETPGSMWVW